jgi:hypothetical protein
MLGKSSMMSHPWKSGFCYCNQGAIFWACAMGPQTTARRTWIVPRSQIVRNRGICPIFSFPCVRIQQRPGGWRTTFIALSSMLVQNQLTLYLSLSYLRSFPFDVLKIDRSFIKDITVDPSDRKLITAIVAMSRSLNLKVVAEGVETKEQFADLKAIGCDFARAIFSANLYPMP